MIYSFFLDDLLTSKRFTTRTEQLTTAEDEGEVRRECLPTCTFLAKWLHVTCCC